MEPIVAVIGGDSVRFGFFANTFIPRSFDFVFRRAAIPNVPIRDATYVLAAVNGRDGVSETRSDSFAVGNGTVTRVRRLRDQTVQEQYTRLR